MMICETYHELVAAHVDGCLTADERREAEHHLASCEQCRALFAQEQQFHAAFAARQVMVPVPSAVEQQLQTALEAENSAQFTLIDRIRTWLAPDPAQPRLAWGTALASLFVIVALFQLLSPSSKARLLATATAYYPAVADGRVPLAYTTHAAEQLQASLNQSGRLDFSTHVLDLQEAGYQLQGGTIASVQGRQTAVVYYAGVEPDTQPVVCLRQRGTMPAPGFGARRISSSAYLYGQDGYSVLISQFSGHFCTLVSRLPGDVFLERLGMHETAS